MRKRSRPMMTTERTVRRRKDDSDEERLAPSRSGNNQYGASGIPKCYHCRVKKFRCDYDRIDPNSICGNCREFSLECGAKLSPKQFRELQREEQAREAERATAENPGVVDLRNLSPRSREVFAAVLEITKRELQGDQTRAQVIRRVGAALQSYAEQVGPNLPSAAAAPTIMQMPTFDPNLPQPFPPTVQLQGFPTSQTTHYTMGMIPAAAFAQFPTSVPGRQMQTFHGPSVAPPTSVAPTTQIQGHPWQWWPTNPDTGEEGSGSQNQ